ncbi:LUD domain-containing protein (plasmid) [Halorussus salilacus]|uniref:LUD domain-containing protein n=1 Tax=Halorussus salilacus TaxID=2953750 RepID=UPI0020A0D485|nr:LUD domain-containing protein [Halorussus salilacus]USZ69878.1 LUD domain-containing protein [Halorussus salilacus]
MTGGASRAEKAARIRRLLDAEGDSVERNTRAFNEGRYDAVAELSDYEELKEQARAIQEDAIERLPELVEQVRQSVEENGGHVYLAEDAADANRYVREVVRERDAETVVKSKSMTSEEIEVNDAVREAGAEVWETDLGEFVVQIADEAPSHIVAPAIHRSREAIAELFEARFDPDEPLETAEDLTAFAREFLAEKIAGADVGMTGANFVAADTGTLTLVTSEGNARKTVAATDAHVAVAGVEKLLPAFEDVSPFVELIARSGTGQSITSYVTFLTPPGDAPTLDFDADEIGERDREFHLVLLDNGRMAMREDDQLRETLYCVRCSACLNSCANFQHVGGHAFGGETYSGGIATGWEAGVHGMESAAEFNDLCTGCTRCVNQCPVGIDVPWINTVVRDRLNRGGEGNFDFLVEGLTPDEEPGGLDLQKRFFGNFPAVAKLGSATAPVSNWLARAPGARALAERALGVDSRRDLPTFRRETLRKWFASRGGARASVRRARRTDASEGHAADPGTASRGIENGDVNGNVNGNVNDNGRVAVLYPDPYTNHVAVERGKAAVRTLEALGVAVRIPDLPPSGRAPLSQGMVATAEARASAVADAFDPHLDAGRDVVVVEPSDLAMFRADYRKLLPEREADRIAENSYELFEYVYGLLENGADASGLQEGGGERLDYHSHCQQRTLGLASYTTAVLDRLGYEVATSDAECCGMAGSFGYKREYYELSREVGESLTEEFAGEGRVVASGTSCCEQLSALREEDVPHPVERIAPVE